MKIFINPGHDIKYDSGAINPHYPMTEAEIALQAGKLVSKYLIDVGYTVAVFQSDNLYYDSNYEDRQDPVCVVANDWESDIFVSLHCNACGDHSARGTECYIYGESNDRLGACIQNQIVTSLNTVDRGVKYRQDLIVLKHTNAPAVLVEMAFIDNDDDYNLLTAQIDDFARAIARGVTDYVSGR